MKLDCILTAVNENKLYIDLIPYFIKCWSKLYPNVDVKVVLIANTIPKDLLIFKDNIILFVPEKNISTCFISQYIRLLYPAILSNYENGIMITDIDIVPANRYYFTKNIKKFDNSNFIYMRNVLIDRKEFAMCYNVASYKTWSNIFGINKIEDIYLRLRQRNSEIKYKDGHGNAGWNTDQLDLYLYVKIWNDKTHKLIILNDKKTGFNRLNRHRFRLDETNIFSNITNSIYSDYHCYRPFKRYKEINLKFYDNLFNSETFNVFITFGAGGQNYYDAGKRLIKQAKSTGYFDKIILYTDKDLENDKEFWNQHSNFISKNKRGYGYWIWKSYIIKKTMEIMKDGDILLYLDCGCEIGGSKQLFIPEFFNYVKKDKIIGSPSGIEKEWCKKDLIKYLNVDNKKILNSRQRQAGASMYLICNETINLVNEWYKLCCNYHMIDDSPSIEPNLDRFKEHRHDQSIFSLLTKKYKMYSQKHMGICVYILRNKSGISQLGKK
jgi:hypothetical protein